MNIKKTILKLIYLPFIILIIFPGCQSKNRKETTLSYTVDISEIPEHKRKIPISEIAESIKYIPLETVPGSILSEISKIVISNSFIYISDQQKLLKFSPEGKFLKQIGNTGRGPGEYTSIDDFEIDKSSKFIYNDTVFIDYKNANIFKQKVLENHSHLISKTNMNKFVKLVDLANSIDKNDNPVLMLVKLKK